jgi:prepilin-type N-terminal cleavage/methylation domain-containing protein
MKTMLESVKPKGARKGFTLVETLVAITILVFALSSFIPLVLLGMQSFQTAKQRYLAVKIAQEGMELAFNKRDNHVHCIKSGPCPIPNWQHNLIGNWEVDATELEDLKPHQRFRNYNPDNFICIKANPVEHRGKFGYCTGPGQGDPIPGNYTREVEITNVFLSDPSPVSNRILVKSRVTWEGRFFSKTITLEEVLFGLP